MAHLRARFGAHSCCLETKRADLCGRLVMITELPSQMRTGPDLFVAVYPYSWQGLVHPVFPFARSEVVFASYTIHTFSELVPLLQHLTMYCVYCTGSHRTNEG